jgi:hypothetical protein
MNRQGNQGEIQSAKSSQSPHPMSAKSVKGQMMRMSGKIHQRTLKILKESHRPSFQRFA